MTSLYNYSKYYLLLFDIFILLYIFFYISTVLQLTTKHGIHLTPEHKNICLTSECLSTNNVMFSFVMPLLPVIGALQRHPMPPTAPPTPCVVVTSVSISDWFCTSEMITQYIVIVYLVDGIANKYLFTYFIVVIHKRY